MKLLTAVTSAISGVVLSAQKPADYRRTIKDLSSLTDYELRDIGIYRGDIETIAMSKEPYVRRRRFF